MSDESQLTVSDKTSEIETPLKKEKNVKKKNQSKFVYPPKEKQKQKHKKKFNHVTVDCTIVLYG